MDNFIDIDRRILKNNVPMSIRDLFRVRKEILSEIMHLFENS
jgi:hypothetical protein